MKLEWTKDFRDFVVSLNAEDVKYVLVGGYAVVSDLQEENTGLFFGFPPHRIDVINFADGVAFDEVWAAREEGEVDGLRFFVISRDLLIQNKRASARSQDLLDVEKLEKRG